MPIFLGASSPLRSCHVSYGRELDVQLCFSRDQNHYSQKKTIGGSIDHVRVQLYSNESTNHRNPFRLSRDIFLDPRAKEVLLIAKSWMQQCISSHSRCTATAKQRSFIPTRLIRLDTVCNDTVCLESPSQHVLYTALSYCWGFSTQPKTTKSNVSARYHPFPVEQLPKTLQDAIFITKGLGLDYIWIDSICIVQDDEDEWAVEASKMADLYSGAEIVIAATHAEDSAEGFLHPRSAPFALSSNKTKQRPFQVHARAVSNHDCHLEIDLDDLPLFQRAWCFQERLLARRVVHFLRDELYFECLVDTKCECGAVAQPVGEELFSRRNLKEESPSAFRALVDMKVLDRQQNMWFGRVWAMILKEYSTLNLTYKKDALPALTGIARSMTHLGPGTYIMGLWEKDIAYQLGWYRDLSHVKAASQLTEEDNLPEQPTFSWIKSPGPIDFHHDNRGTYTSLCTLLAANVHLISSNPYGNVTGGSINLQGKAVPGPKLIEKLYNTGMDIDWGSPVIHFDKGISSYCASCCGPSGHYEGLDTVPDWSLIECFGLYFWSWWDNEHHFVESLLLQREHDGTTYVRIGIVSNLEKDWFDQESIERTVVVI